MTSSPAPVHPAIGPRGRFAEGCCRAVAFVVYNGGDAEPAGTTG